MSLKGKTLEALVAQLAAKVPVPGGGAAAAIAASLGAASGSMAAIYTTRKKDEASGVAEKARELSEALTGAAQTCLDLADADAKAYAELQSTWKKDCELPPEKVEEIKANALNVPVVMLRTCHQHAASVHDFLPMCNPGIRSDAYVSLHLLAGAARAAYQTVLVNNPSEDVKNEMATLLADLSRFEKSTPTPSAVEETASAPAEPPVAGAQ
mmetsp:Transcript_17231/g.30379  ORF Transcript_17231/g.30379 Transcript_17231/m.30379 type:complete len:211 (+) Transcript_17231:38-670(+)|eukprot:CAMPEP_0184540662 /NCGR_PEP_ID=MMETSP0199_2-20130426/840_1 /TAXON_ID=1112570 /ORGANISM="Thraustochytrium sp., Strain LLF1b" /LENGTH=210 /DNA_ID=CAMNT_0026934301 /DNA_START=14 /DNA_END=646 /DNA_ORIENTATION=+